jgi:hypothetical protein
LTCSGAVELTFLVAARALEDGGTEILIDPDTRRCSSLCLRRGRTAAGREAESSLPARVGGAPLGTGTAARDDPPPAPQPAAPTATAEAARIALAVVSDLPETG